MDDLKRFHLSHGRHRSHVSKLLAITNNLFEKSDQTPLTAKEIVSLQCMEELQHKKDTVPELDA